MAEKFHSPNMKKFKDYYPVEGCMDGYKQQFACKKCGHLEDRVELTFYHQSPIGDSMGIKCEKCGTERTILFG